MSKEEEDHPTAASKNPTIRGVVKRGSAISGLKRGSALRASSIAQRQISAEALAWKKLTVKASIIKWGTTNASSDSRASCTTPSGADPSIGQRAVAASVFDFHSNSSSSLEDCQQTTTAMRSGESSEAYKHVTKETQYEVLSPRDKRAQARASYCKPVAEVESDVVSPRDRRAVILNPAMFKWY
jgi:hypothetical protein